MLMHTVIDSFLEGGNMKFVKGMSLMALGMGATIAYQKYSKPLMKKMKKSLDKTTKKVGNQLEDMM